MTRSECMEILSDKSHPLYEELHHTFYTNRNKCREYYNSLGYKGYVLHHKIFNCDNYEEWKIDEIVPMTKSEHSHLHTAVYKQGVGSATSMKKAHESLKEKYSSGELVIWNKGLTKDTDSRIKESPRKGKTGKEFPFLCASKKGKSGGWNRGITPDDPRYVSLKHSDEQNKKASEYMKLHNPMNNEEYRKRQLEGSRNPDVIERRRQKMVGRKMYTNGIERHRYFPGHQPEGYFLLSEYKEMQNEEN